MSDENQTPQQETPSGTSVSPFGGHDAEMLREQTTRSRADLARQSAALREATEQARADMEAKRDALMAQFHRERAALEAQMKPLMDEMARMKETLFTVDLYLGRQEEISVLREGRPAPMDTPIAIRQRVLVMAEESLVMMGKAETGMNADNIPLFVDWLLEDDVNLDRVLPEERGVVVLIPTKVESRSGNIYEDSSRAAQNARAYWLIRNGERVLLMTTDPGLAVIDRILPRRTEFAEIFEKRLFGYGGLASEPVQPGSKEWVEIENKADARRRHFMRLMLVLQGLIDRTTVFHPLRPTGVNLMSLGAQNDDKVVLIQDDEDSALLTDGRETFNEWQRRLNLLMRPGLRIVGDWHNQSFRDEYASGDRWSRGFHPRVSPRGIEDRPETGVPHLIEGRKDKGFVIRFARTQPVWRTQWIETRPGWGYNGQVEVVPTQRASCVVHPDDSWVLPFDLATVEEMEYYLNSRDNRARSFLSLVPVLKSAIAAKHAEAEQEAPFREHLARALVGAGAAEDEAPQIVSDLIHWWKVSNTWARPLNGEPQHEAKAHQAILTEYHARQAAQGDVRTDAIIAAGRRIPNVIGIARTRQGEYRAYSRSLPAQEEGVYLDVTTLRRDGTLGAVKREVVVPARSVGVLQVLWQDEAWSTWKFTANPLHYLTQAERDQAITLARTDLGGTTICVVENRDRSDLSTRYLDVYAWVMDPRTAPVEASSDPMSGSYRGRSQDSAWVSKTYAVKKSREGVETEVRPNTHPAFAYYSKGWGSEALPWGNDAVLVWSDETALEGVAEYRARGRAAAKEEQRVRDAVKARDSRYVRPALKALHQRAESLALAAFREEYGDAFDLWEAHKKTNPVSDPLHPAALGRLVRIADEGGHEIVGARLGDLVAWAKEANAWSGLFAEAKKFLASPAGYETFVMPEPEPEAEPSTNASTESVTPVVTEIQPVLIAPGDGASDDEDLVILEPITSEAADSDPVEG